MERQKDKRYTLAPGTQVREEGFGLLFYTMAGPRLFFLHSGELLDRDFFNGDLTLEKWIRQNTGEEPVQRARIVSLKKSLNQLKEKGVIIEC
jgi:putative mycofactocin binding protein MftB